MPTNPDAVRSRDVAKLLALAGVFLGGCMPPNHAGTAAAPAGGASEAADVLPDKGGSERGPLYYDERSSRGVWVLKIHTSGGAHTFYVSPSDQRKPFAQMDYTLGQVYRVQYVPDPSGESDGLAIDVKPTQDRNKDLAAAVDLVDHFYDDVYFFHLDDAYAQFSSDARAHLTLQAFKDQWPGDDLTQQIDWNGHFVPRRMAIDSATANQVVIVADVTRLFKVQTRSEVRRLTLVRESGQWRVDKIERASSDDFLD